MDKETKSIIKISGIALVLMLIIFSVLFAMKSSGKGSPHRHGSGAEHSH